MLPLIVVMGHSSKLSVSLTIHMLMRFCDLRLSVLRCVQVPPRPQAELAVDQQHHGEVEPAPERDAERHWRTRCRLPRWWCWVSFTTL